MLDAIDADRLAEFWSAALHYSPDQRGSLDAIRWILMADPEGNEFDLGWD